MLVYSAVQSKERLTTHRCGADWVDKKIKRTASVILLYIEVHKDDKDLTPFTLQQSMSKKTIKASSPFLLFHYHNQPITVTAVSLSLSLTLNFTDLKPMLKNAMYIIPSHDNLNMTDVTILTKIFTPKLNSYSSDNPKR